MRRIDSSFLWTILLDLVYIALLPVLCLVLLVASRFLTRPKQRRGLAAKIWSTPKRVGDQRCFWIHAVSVGEVITSVPLVARLREEYRGWDFRLSVSTYTGYDVAKKHFPDIPIFYFPLDLSPIVSRFFRRHRPDAVILLELEMWPNFLLEARRRNIPVLVANGRITERSSRRYAWGRGLTRRTFNLVASFGAQNEEYRERFLRLGVDPAKVEILGNLKHDREPSPIAAKGPETRERLGWKPGEKLVLVAGSTHPGEEAVFTSLYAQLRQADDRLRLVLVPRHVERLDDAELSRWGADRPLVRWSSIKGALAPLGDVMLVVDTVGELELFYSIADLVFVGGSLVPHGGHNLFEAARLGKAVCFGPHVANFREEADLLMREEAALRVAGVPELRAALQRLIGSPEARQELGEKALRVTSRLRGAGQRHLDWVGRQLRLYLGSGAC